MTSPAIAGETTTDRLVYLVTGTDALRFLQGMISNDVLPLGNANGIVWAALLTPQGKYLADFFVVRTDDALLIDCKSDIAEATVARLKLYRLRADVQIVASPIVVTRGLGPMPPGAMADPRHPALGWRAYGLAGTAPSIDWDAIRVANLIPETGVELTPDTYILEAGFEALHGVDFRKGCYVGQEVTARMKHKTELRKGLALVTISGTAQIGSQILSDGKATGTLFTQSNGIAIAYLRFDRTGALTANGVALSLI